MDEREQLEQAIAALETQRLMLGNMVVDTAIGSLRERLKALVGQESHSQQRKQVTVLFADVSGFTAMSETMDPEDVSLTMNALWAPLDRAIVAHGGTIDKHIGDAVMALFGAPTASEDDPENAIRAALAMQEAIAAFTHGLRGSRETGRPLPAISMRIGINTGPVLLGSVGSTGEYTAMGDSVNLASRLEHAAPVGGILISHATYRHVRGVFDVLPLDPISVKGKAEPVQVYVVRKAKPRAFRVTTRGVEGVETGTIGRDAELGRVQERFGMAIAGTTTQSVTIVADAGVGKSRLLYEFNNWLELQPERTLLFKGRCTQEMARLPYSLMRDVFATRFDIQESDSAAIARGKLEAGIKEHLGPDADEQAHFIGHLLGLDFSQSPFVQSVLGDTRQLRDRAFHYCCQYFAAVAGATRTVLLLEDIHWADDGSLDMVEHLLYQQPALPLLILGLARPTLYERRPVWGAVLRNHERIDLKPLSAAQTRQLIAEILKNADEIPRQLEDLIVARVEGNPFYVEELIKMLIEDGVIVTGQPVWRVAAERLASVRVPPTLTGVLQSRLDGLPPLEREIMHQAAVIGRVFWSEVIERMAEAGRAPAAQAGRTGEPLDSLSSKELIFKREPSAFVRTEEYIFKHAILHDVAYERVLKSLRRTYHAQVAEALIDLSGERALEYAGRIGEHFELAGEDDRAATWYAQAGKQAQETYAPETAIGYYQKALALWGDQGGAARLDALGGLGDMLISQARYEEAIAMFTAMRDGARLAGNQRKLARAWCGIASAQAPLGDHHGTLESATAAEQAARAASATEEIALALWMQGRSSFRLGDVDAARSLGEQMLAYTTENDAPRLQTRSLNLLGAIHHIIGDYAAAEDYFGRGLGLCLGLNDQRQIMDLSNNLGVIAEARGDYQLALKRYQEALEVARKIGNRDGELVFLSNLGAARIGLGDHRSAIRDLRQVIGLAGDTAVSGLADTFQYLAQAYLGVGQHAEALEAARQALELSYKENNPAFIAAAWRVSGTIAAHSQPLLLEDGAGGQSVYTAAACFAESLRVCEETGMAGERARTLRDWAACEIERGDRARGLGMWEEARALFAELGAEQEVARMAEPPAPRQREL